jgi:hypothetical protein
MDTTFITDFIGTLTTTQWIIAAVVVLLLAKKFIKFAIIVGLIIFVVLPYLKSSGLLDFEIDQAGILKTVLEQLGL